MTRPDQPMSATNRRAVLKSIAGCGMMTNTSLMATLLNLQATKSVMAQRGGGDGDYKALVCLFLFGGNDSYNMLVPYDGTGSGDLSDSSNDPNITGEYGDYYRVRGGVQYEDGNGTTINSGGLAIPKSDLIEVSARSRRNFGLHPSLAEEDENSPKATLPAAQRGVAGLFNSGHLAFLSNVGSLVRPVDKQSYQQLSNRPLGLFSHSDLQRHWMSGVPQTRNHLNGWGGRLADLLQSPDSNSAVSMNISIAGVNLFQTGESVVPYVIGSGGATQVYDYNTASIQNRIFKSTMDGILDQTYRNLLEKSFAQSHRSSIDAAIEFNTAINDVSITAPFTNETPSNQLRTIARVIGAQSSLGQDRQVFFVSLGGFDNHGNLMTAHGPNLAKLSRALSSFYAALEEQGMENNVVTFTASDFARTLGSNGQGSDHAWGGNQIVMGGGIDGGQVYGEYPESLALGTELDLGRGRLIPTTSVDEFAADLAMWFGVSNGPDLVDILPNIREFYGSGLTSPPIGMFNT